MILFDCSGCARPLKVKPELAGKKVKCPRCGQAVTVPLRAEVASPVPGGDSAPRGGSPQDEKTRLPQEASPPAEKLDGPTLRPTDAGTLPPENKDASHLANHPGTTQESDAEDDRSLTDFLAPPQQPDEIGRLGMYRVLKVLGAGGMGVVYKAEDPGLERLVALKAMLPAIAASASAKKRFLREAKAAAAIKHNHIVTIHQVGEDRGVPFLAMEFLVGESLDDRLKRVAKLPLADVLRIGREMAEGMTAAHELGLVHRDIKPANTWLETRPGRKSVGYHVKILDFGLARAADDQAHLTQSGAIIGTPAYMSPEQSRGGKVDARCDLWSLGVVLYRMCTGAMPFRGADTVSTLMAVALEEPPNPALVNEEVPPDLSDLIMKLLAKDPDKRIGSAHDVAAMLSQMEQTGQSTMISSTQTTAGPKEGGPDSRGKASSKASAPQDGITQAVADRARPTPRRRLPLILAVVLLAAAGALGGILYLTQIRITTEDGDFIIKTDDPNFSFQVSKGKNTVVLKDLLKNRTYELKAVPTEKNKDEYEVELTDLDSGLTFKSKTLIIRRGEVVALTAEFVRAPVVAMMRQDPPPMVPPVLEKKFTNSLGMEFAFVPRGKSWLGGGGGKEGTTEVNIPQDFYLGVYEVTQEEWQKVMDKNPSNFTRTGASRGAVGNIVDDDLKRFPVENVNWHEAKLFVKLVNEKVAKDDREAGWEYRLPTEQQWEYACRGGPMTGKAESAFDFYFEKPALTMSRDQANFLASGLKRPRKVGSYAPNRLGLFDMHGNVREWCEDHTDPKKGWLRAFRGGAWDAEPGNCGVPYRTEGTAQDAHWNSLGLRLARVHVGKNKKTVPTESPSGPLTASIVRKFEGPTGIINGVALSGDGKLVLAGSEDGTANLWDVASGKKIQTYQGNAIRSVAQSDNGKLVLTGSGDHTATLWDAASGKKTKTTLVGVHISSVALSGDGKYFVNGSIQAASLWDAAGGNKIQTFEGHTNAINGVAISRDGKHVLTGSGDGTAALWDAASGKKIQTFQQGGVVWSVALSDDGKHVLTGSWDRTAVLWDLASGKKIQTFKGHTDLVVSVALSADSKYVLTGSDDRTAILWDAVSGKKLHIFEGHTDRVRGVALNRDGKYVLTSSYDKTAILWEVKATPPPAATGFQPMLLDKGLSAWQQHENDESIWKAADDVLLGPKTLKMQRPVTQPFSALFTKDDTFDNFHLKMEFRTEESAVLFFRTKLFTGTKSSGTMYPPDIGYHLNMGRIPQAKGFVNSAGLGGFGRVQSGTEELFVPNTWMSLEIIADGNHFIVKLNDNITMDVRDDKNVFTKGRIALMATNERSLQFRNLQIKHLPATAK